MAGIGEIVSSVIIKKLIDKAITQVGRILIQTPGKFKIKKADLESSLNAHLEMVERWSSEVAFSDLPNQKFLNKVYVDLDIDLVPRRLRMPKESSEKIPLSKIFDYDENHFILLGQPGAGKTTSMKKLCQLVLHDEKFYPERFSFPILVKFREVKFPKEGIISSIGKILGVNLTFEADTSENDKRHWREKAIINYLESLNTIVILDGYDEIQLEKHRDGSLAEIRKLASNLNKTTVIVTSRSSEFRFSIEGAKSLEICPLSFEQIELFVSKWMETPENASKFLNQVKGSPFYDTAIRPLTIAHLCAIFERVGKIPEKPKTVYRKVVNLLLEEWDQQRSIKRTSQYANFEIDRKFEFLTNLAYMLTVSLRSIQFTSDELARIYRSLCADYDLDQGEVKQVVAELETHSGLFLQAGYESFEFAHKSIQEYLTAEYVVRLPKIPTGAKVIGMLANELAIAVAISSNPSQYFVELVLARFQNLHLDGGFVKNFVNRLLLEKPDFNNDKEVGMAALALYTNYRNNGIGPGAQLSLFYDFYDLTEKFEKFITLIFDRNSQDHILMNYHVIEASKSEHNTLIYVFEMGRKIKSEYISPRRLYASETFFSMETRESLNSTL